MTSRRRTPAEPANRQAAAPHLPDPEPEPDDRDMEEIDELYPFPGPFGLGRPPEWVITVSQCPGGQPRQPLSLTEILGNGPARTRDPEPDLEAEP